MSASVLFIGPLALVMAAPIIGTLSRSATRAAATVLGLTVVSAIAMVTVARSQPTPRDIVVAHLVLLASAAAFAGLGRYLATRLDDVLDAAALAFLTMLLFVFGIVAIGAAAGELPVRVLDGVLAANPIVGMAAAIRFDIFRVDLLYRISPLAHGTFTYPSCTMTACLYAIAAAASFAASGRPRRREPATP